MAVEEGLGIKMQDELTRVRDLQTAVAEAMNRLDIDKLVRKLLEMKKTAQAPAFWRDHETAQATMKEIARLEARVTPWQVLHVGIDDLIDLFAISDDEMRSELNEQVADLEQQFEELKGSLRFNGSYDDYDAIVSIYAGAGGTDAQDWAQMLLR